MKLTGILVAAILLMAPGVNETAAQTITGSLGNGTVARGSVAKGKIVLSIPGGLHVNSNRPNNEYSIATTARITGTGTKEARISFPRGKNRKFQFSENTINVYEGRVSFPYTVTVPANFKGNVIRLRVVVRYQACTDEICYPPKSKEITLTAMVR
ncbi:MAG: protein-disulfide reductase DsbD N-terminal domain-containing protein [Pyrinomonadaceae bacterium]